MSRSSTALVAFAAGACGGLAVVAAAMLAVRLQERHIHRAMVGRP